MPPGTEMSPSAGGPGPLQLVAGLSTLFGALFPSVAAGGPIDFTMVGRAIAEFEFTLVLPMRPSIGLLEARGMQ